ncbi:hypothetical protein AAG906_023323 [Vitis piasezkii]
MADTDPHSGEHSGESSISPSVLSELTARMTEALIVEMYVAGKDKLGYINGDLPQPLTTDPSFRRWRTENATVKGWLIGSMDPSLIGNFIRFPTAKQVWDAIATTYFDGSDATQVYELRRRVARLRQGSGSLEKYYNDLQGLWREIDFRRPNPMQCPADIQHFNTMLQEDRVYTFLDGLDDKLDNIRSDVLQLKPFPTVEQAYAHVRREAVRQAVMIANNGEEAAGAVMASRSLKQGPSTAANSLSLNEKFSKSNGPSNDMKCSHYWWHELQAKRRRDGNGNDGGASKNAANGTGKAAIASAESQLSLIPTTTVDLDTGMSFLGTNTTESYDGWILDSGATDHMTYDASDFSERSSPRRTSIANANGDISLVKGLDILTKEIIGRGTKKGGLYYMEDFSIGQANHTRSSSDRNKANILLWHRRLGHPSFGYLKLVFPALFSGLSNLDFKCETCILAKSHRVSYPLSFNKSQMPFELIHSDVWGPSPKSTISGVRWFVIFVDDCTRMTWLYLMKNKDEVFSVFCSFHEMVKTQYSATIRILRSDNGGEYMHLQDSSPCPIHRHLSTLALILPPRVFGRVAFVHLHKNQRTKLDPAPMSFLGYGLHQRDIVATTTMTVPPPPTVSKDPSPENIPEVSSLNTLSTPVLTNDAHVGYELPYRHNRGKPPDRYSPNIEDRRLKYPIANYVSTKTLPEPLKTFADALSSCQVPTSVEEAMKDPRWVQAMKEEMEALLKNKTWILVNLPKGQKTVGCKWVFSIKYKVDGTIERYKARLVAKGFTQTYGVDYQETFSPVAKLNTVRVLLSLAANLDWPLHQFDVKNAFLHGDLEEDIYMDIPSGYVANTEGNIVCKLQRTLYGLKQSPRAWFGRFSTAMKKYGFQQRDDSEEIARLQEQLASEFEMKNLGGLKYFLGIEVARSKRETPIIPNHKLGEYPNQVPTDKGRYQRLVGKLIYLSHTRPDIAYAVSVVSQFMHCPSEDHMSAVMQILRYLKSSRKGTYVLQNDHLREIHLGYFTFVGGNLVTWRSKNFRGMAKGLCELLWLRRLLMRLVLPRLEMKLFCDNKAAIDISHNPIQHDRTKHVK